MEIDWESEWVFINSDKIIFTLAKGEGLDFNGYN
jgi:hypothetical protein